MFFFRISVLDCPECDRPVQKWHTTASIRLGREIAICRHCGARYRTGQFEWANLDTKERVEYFLSEDTTALLVAFGLCLWGYCGGIFAGRDDMQAVAGAGSVIMGSLLGSIWLMRIVSLYFSRRRTSVESVEAA
jgi:hypothetical protein